MAIQAKGDFEIHYGGPWGGLDYSKPYTNIEPNSLAPGSINTTQHNGFLCSSPWIGNNPYSTAIQNGEVILGIFPWHVLAKGTSVSGDTTIIVTNIAVYQSFFNTAVVDGGSPITPQSLAVLHTWAGGEVNVSFMFPGYSVNFVAINGTCFFSGLMLNGIFQVAFAAGTGTPGAATFSQTSAYVSASYIMELGGRLVVAQCRFPGGGGTGLFPQPTIAWSAVGAFTQFDPAVNPQAGFNLLSDVPDQISGLGAIGRSALIFRFEGISQMDPNAGSSNSGLQPFIFYHLWASNQGVGALPNTVAQYGQQLMFLADDNVYQISISGGLQNLGDRIIAKITVDRQTIGNRAGVATNTINNHGYWFYASIVHMSGQLHYLLVISSITIVPPSTNAIFVAQVYDLNLPEGAWHIWDMNQYFEIGGSTQGLAGLSCPITQTREINFHTREGIFNTQVVIESNYLLIAGITGFGTLTAYQLQGNLFQFVPFDYDVNSNPVTPYIAPLYSPLEVPQTTIVFRGEVVSPGHKITQRRLRIQADNAPLPTIQNGAQQIARVSAQGPTVDPRTNTGSSFASPVIAMNGNSAPLSLPIQTYYGNLVGSDEMMQASIKTPILDSANPWMSLAMFRIANVDIIGVDTKGSTQ